MGLYLGVNSGTFVSADGYALYDANNISLTALSSTYKHKIILGNVVYKVNINLPTKESE